MYIITQKCWKTCKKKKALAYIAELHKVKLLKKPKIKNKKKKKKKKKTQGYFLKTASMPLKYNLA